jgi:RimJ/RimL family protein N-acetyltransferase
VRVALRSPTEEDIAAVKPWYEEAVAASMGLPAADAPGIQNLYFGMEAAEADPDAGLLAIVRQSDGTVIGLLDYRANNPDRGWLTMGFIAVARGQRGWGYGSEAVWLLEAEAARKWEAQRFRANVDARNGLGLYFWLRLGYRPARPGEVPGGRRRGIISMVRATGDARG